jgi:DNA polymerase III subunit gamma/tau
MATTLYLKYRPQIINELDIEEVRLNLEKIFESGNIPHAFLFAGPKGTGKTSAARIVAKMLNCESEVVRPCGKCGQCKSITQGSNVDVIEIDAASHRGIDDVRALREAVKLATSGSNKKIYIIDEAHMLTQEASNALLKTIEEPPDHVVFVLATTNPEKLIDTIKSRTFPIYFRKAKIDEIVRSLKRVAKGEKLKIDDNALATIAGKAKGSLRDAIKILEQTVLTTTDYSEKNILKTISTGSGNPRDLVEMLIEKNENQAIGFIENFIENGGNAKDLSESVLEILKENLFIKIGLTDGENELSLDKAGTVSLLNIISSASRNINGSLIEQLPLEIAVIEWCGIDLDEKKDFDSGEKVKTLENKISAKNVQEDKKAGTKVDLEGSDKNTVLENFEGEVLEDGLWARVLTNIRPINSSTEALLRAAKPVNFDGSTLTLGVYYSFHKEKLETKFHRDILEQCLKNIFGGQIRIACVLTKPDLPPQNKSNEVVLEEDDSGDVLKVAKEVFGS